MKTKDELIEMPEEHRLLKELKAIYRPHVLAGSALLDEGVAFWRDKVDWDCLENQSISTCVGGWISLDLKVPTGELLHRLCAGQAWNLYGFDWYSRFDKESPDYDYPQRLIFQAINELWQEQRQTL